MCSCMEDIIKKNVDICLLVRYILKVKNGLFDCCKYKFIKIALNINTNIPILCDIIDKEKNLNIYDSELVRYMCIENKYICMFLMRKYCQSVCEDTMIHMFVNMIDLLSRETVTYIIVQFFIYCNYNNVPYIQMLENKHHLIDFDKVFELLMQTNVLYRIDIINYFVHIKIDIHKYTNNIINTIITRGNYKNIQLLNDLGLSMNDNQIKLIEQYKMFNDIDNENVTFIDIINACRRENLCIESEILKPDINPNYSRKHIDDIETNFVLSKQLQQIIMKYRNNDNNNYEQVQNIPVVCVYKYHEFPIDDNDKIIIKDSIEEQVLKYYHISTVVLWHDGYIFNYQSFCIQLATGIFDDRVYYKASNLINYLYTKIPK